jgi:hypothetical protein
MELNIFFVLVRFLTIRSHGMQSAELDCNHKISIIVYLSNRSLTS